MNSYFQGTPTYKFYFNFYFYFYFFTRIATKNPLRFTKVSTELGNIDVSKWNVDKNLLCMSLYLRF